MRELSNELKSSLISWDYVNLAFHRGSVVKVLYKLLTPPPLKKGQFIYFCAKDCHIIIPSFAPWKLQFAFFISVHQTLVERTDNFVSYFGRKKSLCFSISVMNVTCFDLVAERKQSFFLIVEYLELQSQILQIPPVLNIWEIHQRYM